MPHCPPSSTAFNFESHRVRVFMDEHGVPWFAADDVLAALDLDCKALESLDGDEKGVSTLHPPPGAQDMPTINELGVYSLVAMSCKAEAKRFKRWVTRDVLSSIQKTDSHSVPLAALAEAVANRFLGTGPSPWTKRFPDEFYRLIFQLHGWRWEGPSTPRPGIIAHYTNDLIYARIAPDLLRHLRERNPLDQFGRRKARHHQHLNEDVGHPALASHLYSIISIMRRADSWDSFMLWVDHIHPRWGTNLLLPLVDDMLPSHSLRR